MKIDVYASLDEARPFLTALASLGRPWVFDIETFDAVEFPSRKAVSTNPHHPDFRVRGCAFAVGPDEGAWVEFGSLDLAPADALAALRAAFASADEKGAFNGGFDENGLVYSGWVPVVANRTRDGMLAMLALGDGTHSRLTLTHGVETILRKQMHWDGADKSRMRDIPIAEVADGAVRDACTTYELCDALDAMAEADEHVAWSRLGQRTYANETKRKRKEDDEDVPDDGLAALEAGLDVDSPDEPAGDPFVDPL